LSNAIAAAGCERLALGRAVVGNVGAGIVGGAVRRGRAASQMDIVHVHAGTGEIAKVICAGRWPGGSYRQYGGPEDDHGWKHDADKCRDALILHC
jgi:hypothetical protein